MTILRRALLCGLSAGLLVAGTAGGAQATSGYVNARVWTSPTPQPDPTDPGGRVRGNLQFDGRYTMRVTDVTLTDICPGDGHAVYWFLEVDYTRANKGYKGPKHSSTGSCDSAPEHWSSLSFETTAYQIEKARLWVCVNTDEDGGIDLNGDNDACNQSSWRDNPST